MLSRKSKFVSVMIAMMLVLSLTIPVFADDGVEPVEEPGIEETEVEETSSKFLDHPIVKLFAEFFTSFFNSPVEEESVLDEEDLNGDAGDAGDEGDLNGDAGDEVDLNGDAGGEGEGDGEGGDLEAPPPIVPAEKIASMKEDDKLGFGVIAKLIGIVQCAENGVTLDDLVAQFKDGIGLGELFEMYCKPEHLGVGQIRKDLNPEELDPQGNVKTNNGKAKGKDK